MSWYWEFSIIDKSYTMSYNNNRLTGCDVNIINLFPGGSGGNSGCDDDCECGDDIAAWSRVLPAPDFAYDENNRRDISHLKNIFKKNAPTP